MLSIDVTPKLLCDFKTGTSCDYHRIVLPFAGNKFQPKENVLIFNRIFSRGPDEVKRLKGEGYKIIVDLDDFFELNPEHYMAAVFKGHALDIVDMLKLADAVVVTTEYLASKVRHLNRNIVVIRNALPFDSAQFTMSRDKNSGTPVVWAGGASHEPDLSLVWDTFNDEILTIAGYEVYPGAQPGSYQYLASEEWRKVRGKFPKAAYKSAVKNLNEYMNVYNGHRIAIAPLVDNTFNNCKSNLKILEAGAKGIPIVCSKVLPYYNPVDEGVVIYAENKRDWMFEINKLIRNPNYCRDRGAMLAEHVRLHYHMDDANELRRQLVESL